MKSHHESNIDIRIKINRMRVEILVVFRKLNFTSFCTKKK